MPGGECDYGCADSRPDLSPYVISAGTNLEVYDESWSALRDEYLELAAECGERYTRVKEKSERLAAMDNGVSEAVVELGKVSHAWDTLMTDKRVDEGLS